jgi:formylglycine-generating enzyme
MKRTRSLAQYIWFPLVLIIFCIAIGLRMLSSPATANSDDRGKILNSLIYNITFVSGGTFVMGCTEDQGGYCYEEEYPPHTVTLSSYYIGKYEVTQAQWMTVMGSNPSHFQGCDECPVESVSWDDVQEFLSRLNQLTGKNFRLPTEAEWEFAARGGSIGSPSLFAGGNDLDSVAWNEYNSGDRMHPVGLKAPNELGLYDMSGNVWEWCNDWFGDYDSTAKTNPRGPSKGICRLTRGGSWYHDALHCRISLRECGPPDLRGYFLGFRLASSELN